MVLLLRVDGLKACGIKMELMTEYLCLIIHLGKVYLGEMPHGIMALKIPSLAHTVIFELKQEQLNTSKAILNEIMKIQQVM